MDVTEKEEPRAPHAAYPWRWCCHSCLTWYDLGCTRRCLECSHYFCSRPADHAVLAGAGRRGSKKRSRIRAGTCKSQFDYITWMKWGSWRRTLSSEPSKKQRFSDTFATYEFRGRAVGEEEDGWVAVPESVGEIVGDRKEALYVRGDHDCSLHCDSPSECIHKKHDAISEKRVQYDGSGKVVVIPRRRSQPGFGSRKSQKDNKLEIIEEG
ncbi:hypothetical protein GQ53DRAFT_660932 [Thozetella sp. PMI_491]|nr:hypothetical protein GQ53DRAFT_660932 [Thozetella sp. PMI_491]